MLRSNSAMGDTSMVGVKSATSMTLVTTRQRPRPRRRVPAMAVASTNTGVPCTGAKCRSRSTCQDRRSVRSLKLCRWRAKHGGGGDDGVNKTDTQSRTG